MRCLLLALCCHLWDVFWLSFHPSNICVSTWWSRLVFHFLDVHALFHDLILLGNDMWYFSDQIIHSQTCSSTCSSFLRVVRLHLFVSMTLCLWFDSCFFIVLLESLVASCTFEWSWIWSSTTSMKLFRRLPWEFEVVWWYYLFLLARFNLIKFRWWVFLKKQTFLKLADQGSSVRIWACSVLDLNWLRAIQLDQGSCRWLGRCSVYSRFSFHKRFYWKQLFEVLQSGIGSCSFSDRRCFLWATF